MTVGYVTRQPASNDVALGLASNGTSTVNARVLAVRIVADQQVLS